MSKQSFGELCYLQSKIKKRIRGTKRVQWSWALVGNVQFLGRKGMYESGMSEWVKSPMKVASKVDKLLEFKIHTVSQKSLRRFYT